MVRHEGMPFGCLPIPGRHTLGWGRGGAGILPKQQNVREYASPPRRMKRTETSRNLLVFVQTNRLRLLLANSLRSFHRGRKKETELRGMVRRA